MDRNAPFREVLKQVRKRMRLTQENLAGLAGCSRSLIAGLETGTSPTEAILQRLLDLASESDRAALSNTAEAQGVLKKLGASETGANNGHDDDMISRFLHIRRSQEVDLSGKWEDIWLTTANGEENRNRETISVRLRWNNSWEFSNESPSTDNPDGGYLWVARMELFDNRHILGYYCARDRSILAKGTMTLELQPNGRDLVGVWNGLNFDTMWAHGLVVMCRSAERTPNLGAVLDRFMKTRPKMPY